jgi:hypothetical protein
VYETAGNTLELIGMGNAFLSRTQMAQQLKETIDKRDYVKLKSFCTTNEMGTRLKSQPTEWEKIFVRYTYDKKLIIRIYMELKKLNSHIIKDSMKKWAN